MPATPRFELTKLVIPNSTPAQVYLRASTEVLVFSNARREIEELCFAEEALLEMIEEDEWKKAQLKASLCSLECPSHKNSRSMEDSIPFSS